MCSLPSCNEQPIQIERKIRMKPCEVCGGLENVGIYAGGPFGWLCKKCEPIVDKVLNRYLDYMLFHEFRLVVESLHQHIEDSSCAYCHCSLGENPFEASWLKFCDRKHFELYIDEKKHELSELADSVGVGNTPKEGAP